VKLVRVMSDFGPRLDRDEPMTKMRGLPRVVETKLPLIVLLARAYLDFIFAE